MRKSCCERQHTKRGPWTKQEDQKLIHHINIHGEGTLPKAAGLQRRGKSCRLRWMNYLRPDIKRGNFCLDEEDLIIKLHALLGNRWSLIAGRLPGRTENEVKDYWNSHIKRKLISVGIDPKNHRVNQTLPLSFTTHHTDTDFKDANPSSSISTNTKSTNLSNDHPSLDSASSIHGNDDDNDDDETETDSSAHLNPASPPPSSSSPPYP